MSTSYYRLREPFTSIRIEVGNGHDRVTLWTRHGNAGTLTVDRGDGKRIALILVKYGGDNECPMRTHWGGTSGSVVTENQNNLPNEMTLVSEYGEVLSVADVRKRSGATRKDGMPTELFGYEKKGK